MVWRWSVGFGDIRGSLGRYDPWGIKATGFAVTRKIRHYTAVTDIRFSGQGWYLNAFRAMDVEVSFGRPYRPQSNGLCECMNDEYQKTLRILRSSMKTSNWVQ